MQLEDLDFADDISLLSHKQQDAQKKLRRLGSKSTSDNRGHEDEQQATRSKATTPREDQGG